MVCPLRITKQAYREIRFRIQIWNTRSGTLPLRWGRDEARRQDWTQDCNFTVCF